MVFRWGTASSRKNSFSSRLWMSSATWFKRSIRGKRWYTLTRCQIHSPGTFHSPYW